MAQVKHPWMTPTFRAYRDLERAAVGYRGHSELVVPGLLQEEATARHLIAVSGRGAVAPEVLEDQVAVRMARQERLDDPAATFEFFLYEGTLRRAIGSLAMRRQQLERLLVFPNGPGRSLPQREATSSTSVTRIGLTFTSQQNNTPGR